MDGILRICKSVNLIVSSFSLFVQFAQSYLWTFAKFTSPFITLRNYIVDLHGKDEHTHTHRQNYANNCISIHVKLYCIYLWFIVNCDITDACLEVIPNFILHSSDANISDERTPSDWGPIHSRFATLCACKCDCAYLRHIIWWLLLTPSNKQMS